MHRSQDSSLGFSHAPRRLALALAGAALLALSTTPAHALGQDAMAVDGTQYKADGDMAKVLETLAGLGGKPIETLSADDARKQPTPTDAVMKILRDKGKDTTPEKLVPGVTSVDRTIAGAAGQIPARIYTPDGKGPFPVVVYYHGGGWVIASKEVYDGGARALSKNAKAIVVSVDYRLAPEHKFPASWDDALAAYKWAAANAASLNGDPDRLGLAGESAGGNLAVATAIAAKSAGVTAPKAVLAVYPVAQTDSTSTPSYVDAATAKPLNKAMMAWFTEKVVASPADKTDPRLDLVRADLSGLPPVTVINAQIDPLRSDGDLLVDALKKAGVTVDHKVYTGVTHEFFGMGAVVSKAKDAEGYGGKFLAKALSK